MKCSLLHSPKSIASLLILIFLGCVGGLPAQQKVLIIGVDGVRPDALQAAYTPHMDTLRMTATYSWDALTESPTWSGVGWSGMLTGVWRDKHGVVDNTFNGSVFGAYPHFMQRVEAYDPSLYTASISHWAPINNAIVGSTNLDLISSPPSDTLVRVEAIATLTNQDPDVLFLHFDDVDHNGHGHGFLPTVPEYIGAIEAVDRHVGAIMNALRARPNYLNEDWLILGSTDHGGVASGHGGTSLEERNIYFFASRRGQPSVQLSKTQVITNSNCMPDTMGLRMSGTGDYASVPNHSAFQFGANQDFTLELRIKTSGWSGDPSFLGNKNWNSGANKGFVISSPGGSASNWKVNIGDGNNRADVNGGTIADNMWHHLAVRFDRDGMLRIFKDGIAEDSTSMAAVGDIDNALALGIGQDGTLNYGSGMNGLISEVRIWKTLVDSSTLDAWQCVPLNASHPNYASLVGYWRMNEGAGLNLADAGPFNLSASYAGNTSDWEAVNVLDTTYDYSGTPRIVDVAVSALNHLCIPIQPSWNLDGQAVGVQAAAPQISGNVSTCQLQHEFYTVNPAPGHTVSWSVSNGLIVLGQDSTTVEVQWGGQGPGQVRVQECNVMDTLDIVIDVCAALQAAAPFAWTVYPNPTEEWLKISVDAPVSQSAVLRLYDLTGSLKREMKMQGVETKMDVRSIAPGIYLLELEREEGRKVQRVNIQ